MNHNSKRLLFTNNSSESYPAWKQALEIAGWQVDFQPLQQTPLKTLCQNYQVIVLLPENDWQATIANNPKGQMPAALADCSEAEIAAFLPILSHSRPENIVYLIRLGITDVLLQPCSPEELVESAERVARHRSLFQENIAYSLELERANNELRESLNILKMDQLAGRQVQKSLLPTQPLIHNGYTVSHKIIPSLYLSGDFVAYNLIFDRYILFYLADVSGHGASSAFVTILLRFILRRIIRKHVRENDIRPLAKAPEGFVEHVNRQLLATGLEKQLTMFAGSIDTERHLLRYAVAAQMPMPVFVVGNDARFLPGRGKIIGLFEDATWAVEEIALPDKFQLVMVSDGLLETLPGKGLAEQEEYLLATLAKAPENHKAVCSALGVDSITETADDISILTIFREPTP